MLQQFKQEARSKIATRKDYLSMEHEAGHVITVYLSMAILNHQQSIEFATKFLDTVDPSPLSGLALVHRFQQMRQFSYLPHPKMCAPIDVYISLPGGTLANGNSSLSHNISPHGQRSTKCPPATLGLLGKNPCAAGGQRKQVWFADM